MNTLLYYIGQVLSLKKIKAFVTVICMGMSWLIGGFDVPIQALLVLVTADYILGFSYAWKINNIKGSKMKEGIYKYLLYCIAIIVGNMLDIVIGISNIDQNSIFSFHAIIVMYLCVNEALSVMKHLSGFGVKLPTAIISKLENYKESMEKTDTNP